jgi:hypothetical protein
MFVIAASGVTHDVWFDESSQIFELAVAKVFFFAFPVLVP